MLSTLWGRVFTTMECVQSLDPSVLTSKQDDRKSYLLCIGLFQQSHPKGRGGVASWEAKGGVNAGKPVINYHLRPASMLPKTELEGASVPPVTPLRLVWEQHLKIAKTLVSKSAMKQWCVLCATIPYAGGVYFWARRSMHRETSSLLTAPVWNEPSWCRQGRGLVPHRSSAKRKKEGGCEDK